MSFLLPCDSKTRHFWLCSLFKYCLTIWSLRLHEKIIWYFTRHCFISEHLDNCQCIPTVGCHWPAGGFSYAYTYMEQQLSREFAKARQTLTIRSVVELPLHCFVCVWIRAASMLSDVECVVVNRRVFDWKLQLSKTKQSMFLTSQANLNYF